LNSVSVPKKTRKAIEKIITVKKSISELGEGKRIAEIDNFINEAMENATEYCKKAPVNRIPLGEVDGLFRIILEEIYVKRNLLDENI
jgi:hypothetical protein